ncbi:MAG: protein-disulfide reductase DsbD family protein, partial [Candidatus Eisenbacteria bacterium]|nr:protein-disulfide reductase DsbD family protein [Candidatus Eisenbacteria bacterium]
MIPKRSSGFRPSAASTATTAALLLGLAACVSLPSPAFTSPAIASTPGAPRLPVEPEHARMRLIADCTALHPAETAHLGILFDLDPGWHLYGPGRSDSGLPIEISLDTPDGIVAGRTLWPAPERLVSPGGILDQVYSGTVLVILPIHVSPNLPPGSPASFRVDVSWLVCGTGCLPGEGVDQITLPVLARTDSPRPSPEAPLFRETFARIPREISAADPVRFQWREGAWTVRASGARRMTFH